MVERVAGGHEVVGSRPATPTNSSLSPSVVDGELVLKRKLGDEMTDILFGFEAFAFAKSRDGFLPWDIKIGETVAQPANDD